MISPFEVSYIIQSIPSTGCTNIVTLRKIKRHLFCTDIYVPSLSSVSYALNAFFLPVLLS